MVFVAQPISFAILHLRLNSVPLVMMALLYVEIHVVKLERRNVVVKKIPNVVQIQRCVVEYAVILNLVVHLTTNVV
jgi:hypothetical protein